MTIGIRLTSILCLSIIITACGGGSSSSENSSGPGGSDGDTNNGGGGSNNSGTPEARLGPNQGQILLGPIVGANVFVYDIANLDSAPICTATTMGLESDLGPGVVDFSSCSFTGDRLYFVVARGGDDIDADDDGTLDDVPTPKRGALRGLLTGEQIASGDWRINIMTELAYHGVAQLMLTEPASKELLSALNLFAKRLVRQDLNKDGVIDQKDLHEFIPIRDRGNLSPDALAKLDSVLQAILEGDYDEVTAAARQYLLSSLGEFAYEEHASGFIANSFTVHDNILYALGYIAGDGALNPEDYNLALRILDVTSFPKAELIGQFDMKIDTDPGFVLGDIALYQDHLYAAVDKTGILIFDLTDPAQPELVKIYTASGIHQSSLSTANDQAYISNVADDDTKVLDLSEPGEPVQVAKFDNVVSSVIYDPGSGVLYMIGGGSLFAYDEETLNLIGEYSGPGFGGGEHSVYKDGYIYMEVFGDSADGIEIFDVRDPWAIRRVGRVQGAGLISSLEIAGDRVYVKTQEALSTFSVAAPGELELVDSRSTIGWNIEVDNGRVYVGGNRVIAYEEDSLDSLPSHLAKIDTEREATSLILVGTTAYVADSQQIKIYDVSNPEESIVELGDIGLLDYINDIEVAGDYAYVANETEGLVIVDISDPPNPQVVAKAFEFLRYADGSTRVAAGISLSEDFVYVHLSGAIAVFDIADPADPTLVKEVPFSPRDVDMQVDGSNLFIRNLSGVESFSLKDSEILSKNDSLRVIRTGEQTLQGLEIKSDFAYMTTWRAGLRTVNIANPSAMREAGIARGLGQGNAVSVAGNVAYVANEFGVVDVYDVSDPYDPVFIAQLNIAGTVKDVVATEDYVFAVNVFGLVVEKAVRISEALK